MDLNKCDEDASPKKACQEVFDSSYTDDVDSLPSGVLQPLAS